ncbi:MAG: XdhC family protein [Acidimicrobiia bacterium]
MDAIDRAARLREAGRPFALATVTWRRGPSSGRVGSKAIVHPDGTVEGWMGGACAEPTLVAEALGAMTDGRSRLLVLGEHDHRDGVVQVPMACSSEGAMEVYVEPVLPAPHLHVIGRSPMTATLRGLAEVLGWRVTAVDDPAAEGVGPGSFVVVATQGHYDEPALEAALATEAAYVGLVASAKRASNVFEWLREQGVDEARIARVRAPAGLDLGPTEHQEVAVAILAELVALRSTAAPSVAVAVNPPAQAIDPVCEMTVDPATARWSTTHDGVEYFFCAPGCLKTFERDPAAFV